MAMINNDKIRLTAIFQDNR